LEDDKEPDIPPIGSNAGMLGGPARLRPSTARAYPVKWAVTILLLSAQV